MYYRLKDYIALRKWKFVDRAIYEKGNEHAVGVSKEEFEQRIKDGKLLEFTRFVGNYYGTPLDQVQKLINRGAEVVLEIEVEGAMQVKAKMPDAVLIFIAPPSYDALKMRLLHRGTESEEVILERLEKAHRELTLAAGYDYIVINDDVDNAADRIKAIIRAEHARCRRSLNGYLRLLEETDHE